MSYSKKRTDEIRKDVNEVRYANPIPAWEIFSVKDKLPTINGSYLVYAPHSFPKNSRWLVGEYYEDVRGFYSEASEDFMSDVTHWTNLPNEPK